MRYTGYAFDQVIGVKVVVTDFTDEINNSKLYLELPIALMDGSYSSVVVTGYDENGDSTTLQVGLVMMIRSWSVRSIRDMKRYK